VKFFGLVISILIWSGAFGQTLKMDDIHYRNFFSGTHFENNFAAHTSIKPMIYYSPSGSLKSYANHSNHNVSWWVNDNFEIYPIVDLGVGYDNIKGLAYDLGAGFASSIAKNKWCISAKILPYYSQPNYIEDSIQSSQIDLGTGRPISFTKSTFFRGELVGIYRLNKFFTFTGGYGKNFFGEGYRSLLLSDHAAANPYLKIETTFHTIKYVNLFNVWNDFYQIDDSSKPITKLSAMHYLSWNITKRFNLSLFETVIWQAKDSLNTRYFEPNYMNPFVFYRPVEYGLGSSDNVLVGLNISYKPSSKSTIYYQLILDEFLISELRSDQKWWGNKYGMQLGVKMTDLPVPNLYAQMELNFVRPFTYSHKESIQSYSHANASVAHPLGANFYELNTIISYKHNKQRFTGQITYAGYGADTSSISYGQNVLASYANRDDNYGHTIMQGEKHNVLSVSFICEYPVPNFKNMFLTAKYKWRSDWVNYKQHSNHFIEIGIRSRIWNAYDDI